MNLAGDRFTVVDVGPQAARGAEGASYPHRACDHEIDEKEGGTCPGACALWQLPQTERPAVQLRGPRPGVSALDGTRGEAVDQMALQEGEQHRHRYRA